MYCIHLRTSTIHYDKVAGGRKDEVTILILCLVSIFAFVHLRVHLYYFRRKIIIYTLLRYTCAVNIVFIKVQYVQQNLIINIHYRRNEFCKLLQLYIAILYCIYCFKIFKNRYSE